MRTSAWVKRLQVAHAWDLFQSRATCVHKGRPAVCGRPGYGSNRAQDGEAATAGFHFSEALIKWSFNLYAAFLAPCLSLLCGGLAVGGLFAFAHDVEAGLGIGIGARKLDWDYCGAFSAFEQAIEGLEEY